MAEQLDIDILKSYLILLKNDLENFSYTLERVYKKSEKEFNEFKYKDELEYIKKGTEDRIERLRRAIPRTKYALNVSEEISRFVENDVIPLLKKLKEKEKWMNEHWKESIPRELYNELKEKIYDLYRADRSAYSALNIAKETYKKLKEIDLSDKLLDIPPLEPLSEEEKKKEEFKKIAVFLTMIGVGFGILKLLSLSSPSPTGLSVLPINNIFGFDFSLISIAAFSIVVVVYTIAKLTGRW